MAGALTARVFVFCSVFLLSLSLFAVAVPFNAYSDFQAQRIDTVYTIDVTPSQLSPFTATRVNDRGILDIGKNIVAGVKKKPRYISDGLPDGQSGTSRPMMLPPPSENSREEDLTYSQIKQFRKKMTNARYCNDRDDDKQIVCSRCISPLRMNRVYYREGGFPIKDSSEFELSARYIAQVCDQFEAPVYRDACVSKVFDEGVYPSSREVGWDISRELRAVRFGLMAWCDLTLWFTDDPEVRVVDHSTGSIEVNWNTSIISSSSVLIYNLSNPETDSFARPLIFSDDLSKEHNTAYSGLVSGIYRVAITSAVQTPFDSWWQVVQDYVDVAIYREGPPELAVLTYVAPTPDDGGSLRSSSVTIAISSTQPLQRATLQWGSASSAMSSHQMRSSSSTEFTFTKTMLNIVPGNYVYRVTGIDLQGASVEAPFRTVLVVPIKSAPPLLTFAPPTPANGTALENDQVTIAIVSDTPLQSATLIATNPDHSTSQMPMTTVNPTSFTLTFNGRAGTTSYYVRGLSVDNDYGETERRTVTLPRPVVDFVNPTLESGASVTYNDTITIRVSSNEPLASASLVLSNGRSTSSFPMSRTTPTQYTYTLNGLLPGEYSFSVTVLDSQGDQAETATRSFTVTHVAIPPVITFAPPTPASGTALESDSVTIAIVSNVPLQSATLIATNLDRSILQMPMTAINPTSFTLSFNGRAGATSYFVRGLSVNNNYGETERRTVTLPLPVVDFVDPTPENGASVTDSEEVTIRVSSNEPLASATLVLSDGRSTGSLPMSRITATQYTYTLNALRSGGYSFRATVLDDEGDQAETTTRSFTVTHVATPPVITFSPPTPVDSSTLVNDSLIVYVDSSEALASATLEFTNNGETTRYEMGGVSQTRFTLAVDNLYNGSVSFRVNAVDSQGDSGESETRVATVPITFQTHEFQGEAIGAMGVFGDYMYVGTYNETAPGQGKVWRSRDAVNWEPVFYANFSHHVDGVIIAASGVFSMTTYNDGMGEALYIGTGSFTEGMIDGDVYRSYDGTHWEQMWHNDDQVTRALTVIDGALYVGTRTHDAGGHVLRYDARGWTVLSNVVREVKAVEKYNGEIYYVTFAGVYKLGTEERGVISPQYGWAMKTYYNKLYMGTADESGNTLLKTTNPATWISENLPNSFFMPNLRELSDGYLYMPVFKRDSANLWRRNAAGVNEVVVDFAPKNGVRDIIEFNGKKYVGISEWFEEGGPTNIWGYIYKLTDNNARDTSTPPVEDRWIWSSYNVVSDLWRDWRGVQNSPWQYMYFQPSATRVNSTQVGICYGAGECWVSGEATDQTLAAQDASDVLIQVGSSGGRPHPNLAFRYYLTQFGNYTVNGTASDRGGGDGMNYTVFLNNREVCSGLIANTDINCNLGTEIEAGSYVEVTIGANANSNGDFGHLALTIHGFTGRLDPG